nr:MAG TPA: hypothetical protein [Caudoviricetes sp.]
MCKILLFAEAYLHPPFTRRVYHKNKGCEKYKKLSNQGGKYHD